MKQAHRTELRQGSMLGTLQQHTLSLQAVQGQACPKYTCIPGFLQEFWLFRYCQTTEFPGQSRFQKELHKACCQNVVYMSTLYSFSQKFILLRHYLVDFPSSNINVVTPAYQENKARIFHTEKTTKQRKPSRICDLWHCKVAFPQQILFL